MVGLSNHPVTGSRQPLVSRMLQQCNDIELNPGPKNGSPMKKSISSVKLNGLNSNKSDNNGDARDNLPAHDPPRIKKLEEDFANISSMVSNIDSSIQSLMKTIEEMKPAYVHALKIMNTANNPTQDQKNNLVFYGLPPEPLEKQMEKEPEFCRDILETRIKMVFREHLKISRDIPFMTVYRFTQATTDPDEVRPIIATFRSLRDKENILRHASSSRSLKKDGVYVTEDYGNKVRKPKNQLQSPTKTSEDMKRTAREIRERMRENIRENLKDEGNLRDTIREDIPFHQNKESKNMQKLLAVENKIKSTLGPINGKSNNNGDTADNRSNLASSAGMDDRMSSCNSDYAPSSNSGSSGPYSDD